VILALRFVEQCPVRSAHDGATPAVISASKQLNSSSKARRVETDHLLGTKGECFVIHARQGMRGGRFLRK